MFTFFAGVTFFCSVTRPLNLILISLNSIDLVTFRENGDFDNCFGFLTNFKSGGPVFLENIFCVFCARKRVIKWTWTMETCYQSKAKSLE